MLIDAGFRSGSCELVPIFLVKTPSKNRYKHVNTGQMWGTRSHGLSSYFPVIVRVCTRANVNKMLTEKKIVVAAVNPGHKNCR